MNEEIKEIVDDLIKNRDKLVRGFYFPEDLLGTLDLIKLIDYITNLQQEIERLRNEIKKISEQHIYTLDKLIETQTRIEKINEYIKENGYIDLNGYDLLKITGGDEE